MIKSKYFLFVFFFLSSFVYAQDTTNQHIERKLGVSTELGGVLFGSFVVDYFVQPTLQIEVNFLPVKRKELFSFGGGVKYHPWGNEIDRRWSPYIGLKAGYVEIFFISQQNMINYYIPVGINYTGNKGFDFSADIGLFNERNQGDFESRIKTYLMAGVKLGYRFKSR